MDKLKQTFRSDSKYMLFLISVLIMELGYGLYKGVIDNYLAEVVAMNEFDKGVSEFFREMPGLFLVLILAVFYTASAETLYKIGAVIMLGGLALHAIVPASKVLIIMSILIYSTGEHIQLGMKSTIALQYSREGKGGRGQGYMKSMAEIGTMIGYVVIIIVFSISSRGQSGSTQNAISGSTLAAISGGLTSDAGSQPFKPVFWAATALTGISLISCLGLKSTSATDKSRSRFYFRKKFKKYYMLEVFYGARKQVFFTFGPFVLILFYKANAVVISALYAISAVACFFLAPVVGKIIDRAGYRIVMIMDTIILVAVCFFYGFAHHIFPERVAFYVCCANYVLDSVISLASMASNVYVQDISDSAEECRATISTGISVNHMITILIALFGGWIWQTLGMETLFILSAVLGLCNSAYAASIPKKTKNA